ncbi:MAG: glycosyltransferase, partial [Nitrospirae bacterium]|nr:glycosyltransferase [Nitrospirota bacterium]
MRRLKVLHLISSKGLYGAERVVVELCKGLLKRGDCQPVVGVIMNEYNPHAEVAEEARANNIETFVFPCRSQFDLKLARSIRSFVREKRIDIVHCHGYKSNFYGLFASVKNVPAVTTNHNWLRSHWRLKVYCFLDSLWIRYFGRIVAVSEGVKNDMLRFGVPEEKIVVIDNGIDLGRFDGRVSTGSLRTEFGLNGDEKVVGTIGSLGHEKGHVYLLKAARDIVRAGDSVRFLIVGDGPLRDELKRMVVELGIEESVTFTGYRKDVPELLSVMDIFVLPSVKEGLPMVLLEAMASKKPVIATRVGAV